MYLSYFPLRRLSWVIILTMFSASICVAGGPGVSLKIGTTGFGGDLAVGVGERFNLRAGVNVFSLSADSEDEIDQETIRLRLKLLTVPLLLDWHPFEGNFRLSAGVAFNNNEIKINAEPGSVIELNDREYAVDDMSMGVTFNQLSPYAGIGYGNSVRGDSRLVFAFDLGLMFHGTPKLRTSATASNPAQQAALDRDLAIETDDFRDDLSSFKFYPVLTFGMSYRF